MGHRGSGRYAFVGGTVGRSLLIGAAIPERRITIVPVWKGGSCQLGIAKLTGTVGNIPRDLDCSGS